MAETRWLSEKEQEAWRGLIEMWRLLMSELERQLQRDHGLSHTDYEVLVCLSEAPKWRLRMSDLAARTCLSRSRLSHQMRRMEQAGLARRDTCPTDKRGSFAVLTDHGWATIQAAAPGHVDAVREHLFDHLTSTQVRQLSRITGPVLHQLRQVRQPGDHVNVDR